MKNNQSLHLTIKQPPNPKPIRTIAILDDPDNPNVPQLINHFLAGIDFEPKSQEFEGNVKDEVLKLLTSQKPIAVARQGRITVVYFQE
jgi:hypothetical protein